MKDATPFEVYVDKVDKESRRHGIEMDKIEKELENARKKCKHEFFYVAGNAVESGTYHCKKCLYERNKI